jgi:hypothetical protein
MYTRKRRDAKGKKAAADFNNIPIATSPFSLSNISSNTYNCMIRYCDYANICVQIL